MCHLIVHLIVHLISHHFLLLWKFRMFPAKSRATCATCAPGSQAVLTKASTWSIQNEDVTEGIGVGQVTGIDGDIWWPKACPETNWERRQQIWQRHAETTPDFASLFPDFPMIRGRSNCAGPIGIPRGLTTGHQLSKWRAVDEVHRTGPAESCWVGSLFLLVFCCRPRRPESGNKSIGHSGFSTVYIKFHQIVFWFLEVSNNCCSNGALMFSCFDWSWVNIHATFDTFHGTSTNDVIAWNIWNTMFQTRD